MQTPQALQVPDEFLSLEAPAGGRARAALGLARQRAGGCGAALCALSLAGSRLSARRGSKKALETAIPCRFSLVFPATDPRAPLFTSSLPLCSAAKQP